MSQMGMGGGLPGLGGGMPGLGGANPMDMLKMLGGGR
jgi:hypothetical protein